MTASAEDNANKTEKDGSSSRRDFVKQAAVAGLVGVAAMAPAVAQAAAPQSEVEDPQRPAGLRPGAELDCRFSVSFEKSVPESMRLVTEYFGALNRRDHQGLAKTFHYPYVSYEGIDTVIVDSADHFLSSPPASVNVSGKGETKIRANSYDILDSIELLLYGPCGVGLALNYSRYRADGHKLFGVYGIYGITNNDGKWGIEYMSTIFRPADQLHLTYDAEAFSLRSVHDTYRVHDLGRKYNNSEQVRKSMLATGKWGSVGIGAGSNGSAVPAREGRPMDPYKIKGVKSRLHVHETTQEEIDNPGAEVKDRWAKNQKTFLDVSGAGVDKWYQSLEWVGTRVLNADMEKAHAISGFARYAEDGTLISQETFMTVLTFRNMEWLPVDGPAKFCCSMYQDHTNDVRPSDV
jgi:hypothetical protein